MRAKHGSPMWLAVGRLVYYKGLSTAIRALANVPGKLMVIGSGPLKAELEAATAQQLERVRSHHLVGLRQ